MPKRSNPAATARRADAPASVFAALGDETRLNLVGKLGAGETRSITDLAEGSRMTRQAVTKHLKVLEGAGLVRGHRSGRETLFRLVPEPLAAAQDYLSEVSRQWDDALARLKAFVEE